MTEQRDQNHLLRTYDDRSRAIEGEREWAVDAKACSDAWQDADERIDELERELEEAQDGLAYWRNRFAMLNGEDGYGGEE